MAPRYAPDDATHVRLCRAEPFGDGLLLCSQLVEAADLPNVVIGQFRVAVGFATGLALAFHLVRNIVCVGAEHQVGGVAAWRVVACVADQHVCGEFQPCVQFPCDDVRIATPAAPHGERSVVLCAGASPFPAFVGFARRGVQVEAFSQVVRMESGQHGSIDFNPALAPHVVCGAESARDVLAAATVDCAGSTLDVDLFGLAHWGSLLVPLVMHLA